MSQAKVDRYKEEKANRKKTLARNKVKRAVAITCAWAVVIGLLGWAGYSTYSYYESKRPAETYTVNLDALDDYLTGLEN